MRTPITYYGGKQRLADTIVSMIPNHRLYCEPFLGGGAVFFSKPKARIEVINDINSGLVNFYLCLQNQFEELQGMIRKTLHSETIYYRAKDIWNGRISSSEIEKAWAFWVITNGSFASSAHGGWKWCNGTSGGHTGNFLRGKRKDFNEQLHHRLDNVQISCRDALRVIKERDTPDTFFYLDPPYPGSYQGHYSGYTFKNLWELLDLLAGIKGKFVLSNYWSQTLRYHIFKDGWNYKQVEVFLRMANLGRGTKVQKRTEILVYNYPLPNQTLF